MGQQVSRTSHFGQLVRNSLKSQVNLATVRVARDQPIYVSGDLADVVYLVELGQVKLSMFSQEGKECLLAIHTAGDIFGELCLAGSISRQEAAIAMEDSVLKKIPCQVFFDCLTRHSLLQGFAQHLATRICEQQKIIATLLTVDSEHRLGETLLLLARKLGKPNPQSTRIESKITHEDLSRMVGTTRPRVTHFLARFRGLGLIETSSKHHLIVNEEKLASYLRLAQTHFHA
jgi:CRP/FNR family transcriptional regulator, cyclic AMP receptor protein